MARCHGPREEAQLAAHHPAARTTAPKINENRPMLRLRCCFSDLPHEHGRSSNDRRFDPIPLFDASFPRANADSIGANGVSKEWNGSSIRANEVSICANEVSICANEVSICANEVSICANEVSICA